MTNSIKKYVDDNDTRKDSRFKCPKKLKYQFTPENKLLISHWCCYGMKEQPLKKWARKMNFTYVITGIRQAEGGNRVTSKCLAFYRGSLVRFNPLAPCSDDFMDWMVDAYDIKLPIVYYPPYNFLRTGCKGCPFALNLQQELDVLEEFFPEERKQCEIIWKPVYDEYRRLNYRLRGEKNDS